MKNMKKVMLIVLATMLLGGCSSQTDKNVTTPAPVTSTEPETTAPAPEKSEEPKPEPVKIKELPELRVLNLGLKQKAQPEGEKEAKVVFETAGTIRSHPVVSGNLMYFGDSNGAFYALDLNTYKPAWTYETGLKVITKPVLEGGNIVFNCGNSLFCLNALTGEEQWKFTFQVDSSFRGISGSNYDFRDTSVAVYEGTVYYSAYDGTIVQVDMSTGKELWHNTPEFAVPVCSGLDIYQDKLFYNTLMGYLYCMDLKTHELCYTLIHNDPIYSPMLFEDGIIYFAGRTCCAYAVDAGTGKVLWDTQVPSKTSWYSGGPVIKGDEVFFGTSDEFNMVVLDKKTGAFLRMYRTNTNVFTQSVIYKDQLIVCDIEVRSKGRGSIQSFDTNTENRKLWEIKLDEGLLSSPVVVENKIYFGSDKGKLYCIELD